MNKIITLKYLYNIIFLYFQSAGLVNTKVLMIVHTILGVGAYERLGKEMSRNIKYNMQKLVDWNSIFSKSFYYN